MSQQRAIGHLIAVAVLATAVVVGGPSPASLAQGPPIGGSGDRYYLRNSHGPGGADVAFAFGLSSDVVLVGDWDGNGSDTLAVRRGNQYHLKNTHTGGVANVMFTYGTATDGVLVGDWDGDGVDTLALRRGNRYYLKNSHSGGNADVTFTYGTVSDGVVVGDWDGDGVDSLGLRRGSTYYLRNSHSDGNAHLTYSFGRTTDRGFAGDWNGDRVDTLGVRRNIAPPPPPPPPNPVLEVQRILSSLAIPAGPVDGVWGARTAQGLCTFRQVAGLPVSRGYVTSADLTRLRAYDAAYATVSSIPAPNRNGASTYLLANKTCQTMLYARGGTYVRVFRISTGTREFETPVGNAWLGSTRPGWSCSTLYPEGCYYYDQGMNALYTTKNVLYSKFGNMYNKRTIWGSIMLHGSASVPTYPASHGCVRVTITDSDWMYRNMSNSAGTIYLSIIGSY